VQIYTFNLLGSCESLYIFFIVYLNHNALIFILCLSKAIGNPLDVTIRNFSVHIFDIRHVSTIQSSENHNVRAISVFSGIETIYCRTQVSPLGTFHRFSVFPTNSAFSPHSSYVRFVSTHANLTIHIFMNFHSPLAGFVISCVFKFVLAARYATRRLLKFLLTHNKFFFLL